MPRPLLLCFCVLCLVTVLSVFSAFSGLACYFFPFSSVPPWFFLGIITLSLESVVLLWGLSFSDFIEERLLSAAFLVRWNPFGFPHCALSVVQPDLAGNKRLWFFFFSPYTRVLYLLSLTLAGFFTVCTFLALLPFSGACFPLPNSKLIFCFFALLTCVGTFLQTLPGGFCFLPANF